MYNRKDYYKCINCNSEKFQIKVNINIVIAPKYFQKLTKRAFQPKDVQLLCVDWDKAWVISKNCHYFNRLFEMEKEGGQDN